jgi:hypothetical protein
MWASGPATRTGFRVQGESDRCLESFVWASSGRRAMQQSLRSSQNLSRWVDSVSSSVDSSKSVRKRLAQV